jgi:hypothetical protein
MRDEADMGARTIEQLVNFLLIAAAVGVLFRLAWGG